MKKHALTHVFKTANVLILILIVLLPIGCSQLKDNQAESTPDVTSEDQDGETNTTPSPQTLRTYTNPTAGFSVQIPDEWYSVPESDTPDWQTSVFANFDLLSSPPTESETFAEPGQIKIEIGLHPHQIQQGKNLEEWAGEHFWDIPSNNTVSEIRNDSTLGIQTILTLEDGNKLLLGLFAKGADVVYVMAGSYSIENSEHINNVLSSIEFDD